MPSKLYSAFVLLTCIAYLACRRDDVVSTYQEVPTMVEASIEMPEITFPSGSAPGASPIGIPANKRVALRGRVSGISAISDGVTFAIIHVHPRGNRNTTYGSAVMNVTSLNKDILEYEAIVEPLNHIGQVELQVQFNLEKPIFVAGRISKTAAAPP